MGEGKEVWKVDGPIPGCVTLTPVVTTAQFCPRDVIQGEEEVRVSERAEYTVSQETCMQPLSKCPTLFIQRGQ